MSEICDFNINEEFKNTLKWADENRLKVNMSKTNELVFQNVRNYLASAEIPGIDRFLCAKLVREWLQNELGVRILHNAHM